MKRILKKPEKEKLIKDIKLFLIAEMPHIKAAYIFGSFNYDESFSDIDIGILLEEAPSDPMSFELELEAVLYGLLHIPVDIRILNQAPISFSQNVIRNGMVILDQDSNLRADFENLTLKKYFDFSFFRRRYLEDVTNAPL